MKRPWWGVPPTQAWDFIVLVCGHRVYPSSKPMRVRHCCGLKYKVTREYVERIP